MSKYTITEKGKKAIAKGTDLIKAIQKVLRDNEMSSSEIAKVLVIHPKMAKICINMLAAQGYIEKKKGK